MSVTLMVIESSIKDTSFSKDRNKFPNGVQPREVLTVFYRCKYVIYIYTVKV